MLALLLKVLLSYLLGSVSGSMVLGAFRQVDIRDSGSGNAGGTNAFRTQGFWFAFGVVLIDIGKGALAAWLFPQFEMAALGEAVPPEVQLLACGFAAVVGHCYPLWYGFRGGKGAATAIGALLIIQPSAVLPMLGVWIGVLLISGYVGLSTVLAAISLLPAVAWLDESASRIAFAGLLAVFLTFTHRGNIRRLLDGTESRFERVRIVNWFR